MWHLLYSAVLLKRAISTSPDKYISKLVVASEVMVLRVASIACVPLLLHRGSVISICVEFLSSNVSNLFKTKLELKRCKCMLIDYS